MFIGTIYAIRILCIKILSHYLYINNSFLDIPNI